MPVVQRVMDGEQAHNFAIALAKYGLVPFKKTLKNEQILVIIDLLFSIIKFFFKLLTN